MIDKYHPIIPHINKAIKKLRSKSIIVDVGTSGRFVKEVKFFENDLKHHHYFSLGYNSQACDISGDALHLPLKSKSLDCVLSFEVIEHVSNPFQVIEETFRVLKPGGLLILTTPFLATYHGLGTNFNDYSHNSYPDFWRFTHQGLQYLCKDFTSVTVIPFSSTYGYYLNMILTLAHLKFVIPLIHRLPFFVGKLSRLGNPTYRHLVIAIK